LAVLLAFVLTPVVRRLERWRLPRVVAVVLVTLAVGLLGVGAFAALAGQIVSFSDELPQYRSNIAQKLTAIRESVNPYLKQIETTSEAVDEMIDETTTDETTDSSTTDSTETTDSTSTTDDDGTSGSATAPTTTTDP